MQVSVFCVFMLYFSVPLFDQPAFCVGDSADLPCLVDVTRCLQLAAAAAGGPSAQTESAGGIKGPSPKKATGVGLRLVCSLCCLEVSGLHSHIAHMCFSKGLHDIPHLCLRALKVQFKHHYRSWELKDFRFGCAACV